MHAKEDMMRGFNVDQKEQHRLPPEKTEFARQLRRNSTLPERMLWECLRAKRLHGIKFRRQHVIGPYVADFYCAAAALVIELDGENHNDMVERDKERTDYLERNGYSVVRYLNDDVVDHLEGVVEDIFRRVSCAVKTVPRRKTKAARNEEPSPNPSLKGRGV